MVNARLSDKSCKAYKKIKFFIAPVMNTLDGILCQDQSTLTNFIALGYRGFIKVVGSTKFDLSFKNVSAHKLDFLKDNCGNKKIITLASSRDTEEKLLVESITNWDNCVYLIIPRHPERFRVVEKLLLDKNIKYQKRSANEMIDKDTQVLLGDSLGEMFAYFELSDIVFMGGSFGNTGGQNIIEPIFMHKPVIFGLSMFNFEEISKNAIKLCCGVQVQDFKEAIKIAESLLSDDNRYKDMVANCRLFIREFQGASDRIMNIVGEKIEPSTLSGNGSN